MNIGFVTIPVTSLEETIKFYQEVLGFDIVNRFAAGPQMQIAFMADKKGSQLEFIQENNKIVEHDGMISVGFYVEDIHATAEHLKKHNVTITYGPIALPSGVKLLHAEDLNGVGLGFAQMP